MNTYHLVNAGDLGLQNSDGISNGGLLVVGDGGGAEGAILKRAKLRALLSSS